MIRSASSVATSKLFSGLEIAQSNTYAITSSLCLSWRSFSHSKVDPWDKMFVEVHERPTNRGKIDFLFRKYLQTTLCHLDRPCPSSVDKAWEEFRDFVSSAKDANVYPYNQMQTYSLASYNAQNAMNKACRLLALVHQQPMLKEGTLHKSYLPTQFNSSSSDSYWSEEHPVDPPFIQKQEGVCQNFGELDDLLRNPLPRESNELAVSSDQELRRIRAYALLHGAKDAAVASRLTSPLIEKDSVFHEIGCFNGENSINNLMYCKATRGKFPGFYLGTDINPGAVSMSAMTFGTFDFPFPSKFYVANSTSPLGISSALQFNQVTVLALRVIPIFDPSNAENFMKQVGKEWKGRDLSFVVSYAVPSGSIYQRNQLKLKDKTIEVQQSCFNGGSCFTQKHGRVGTVVLQTYYERDAFNRLAKDCGFRVEEVFSAKDLDSNHLHGTSDPFCHREVALLSPLK